MEHIEERIMEVLNRNLNNYWNSVSDGTKEIIKDEIIEAIEDDLKPQIPDDMNIKEIARING